MQKRKQKTQIGNIREKSIYTINKRTGKKTKITRSYEHMIYRAEDIER